MEIAAERYRRGLAPLIIATGGVNRHNQIIEGRVFRDLLVERGVPAGVIRVEDQSANTWENVERALPFLREALAAGLAVTAVTKWYHRRAVHVLKTVAPEIGPFHAIGWDPVYSGEVITRHNWPDVPAARRRVVREWDEVTRRVGDGSFATAERSGGVWR
ncbi:YdcF family protein [Actinomadura decatromicini]|uniref:YdcF family protein n=1 Tax=Actinomadura decatromicini TaxID=2604572 RepID=UPI0016531BB6|nr:YdcF family protein [Actinomadura decatromicini]